MSNTNNVYTTKLDDQLANQLADQLVDQSERDRLVNEYLNGLMQNVQSYNDNWLLTHTPEERGAVPLASLPPTTAETSYYQPNPNALSLNDPRVKAMKERQKKWQQLLENGDPTLQTIRPNNSNPNKPEDPRLKDPRITLAIANAEERTYNSYYKKLNNNKNFDPNWRNNPDWEFYSLPPTSHKNGGTLQQSYRDWEKEMYDSYKCGGKTKKKSCGGAMNTKKKACGGMKVKK